MSDELTWENYKNKKAFSSPFGNEATNWNSAFGCNNISSNSNPQEGVFFSHPCVCLSRNSTLKTSLFAWQPLQESALTGKNRHGKSVLCRPFFRNREWMHSEMVIRDIGALNQVLDICYKINPNAKIKPQYCCPIDENYLWGRVHHFFHLDPRSVKIIRGCVKIFILLSLANKRWWLLHKAEKGAIANPDVHFKD